MTYLKVPLVAQMVKKLPAMRDTWVWSLGQEDSLEKGMATHSSILSGESHRQRNLVGYSPWDHKELDMTEWLTHSFYITYLLSMMSSRSIHEVISDRTFFRFHYICIPHFLYPFILEGHLGCFCILAIVTNTGINLGEQIALRYLVFISFRYISIVVEPVYTPTTVHKNSLFSTSSSTFFSLILGNTRSNRCEVISHDFDVNFPDY